MTPGRFSTDGGRGGRPLAVTSAVGPPWWVLRGSGSRHGPLRQVREPFRGAPGGPCSTPGQLQAAMRCAPGAVGGQRALPQRVTDVLTCPGGEGPRRSPHSSISPSGTRRRRRSVSWVMAASAARLLRKEVKRLRSAAQLDTRAGDARRGSGSPSSGRDAPQPITSAKTPLPRRSRSGFPRRRDSWGALLGHRSAMEGRPQLGSEVAGPGSPIAVA